MSYFSQYVVFSPEKAELLFSVNLLHQSLADEELLSEYISLGSIETYVVSDPGIIEDVAVAHSLKFYNYLDKETLLTLFKVLDSTKISCILPNEGDRLGETRHEMALLLDYIADIIDNDDPLDTMYSLDEVQRYAVPLFEEHGMIIYTKVKKSTIIDLVATLDPLKVEVAIKRSSFIREANALYQEGLMQTLTGLKKIVTALQENPQSLLIFEDDYGMCPEHYASELLQKVKSLL